MLLCIVDIAEPIFLANNLVLTPKVDAEPLLSSAETASLFNSSLILN